MFFFSLSVGKKQKGAFAFVILQWNEEKVTKNNNNNNEELQMQDAFQNSLVNQISNFCHGSRIVCDLGE